MIAGKPAFMSRHDPVVKLMSEVREEEHRRRIETAAEVLTALQTFLASRSKRLTTLFLEWDTDGDGSVTLSELTAGLHQMGLELSASELLALFNLFDRDGDGRVDVAEFAFVMRTANTAAAMAELQLKTLKRLSFDSERVRALQNADARFEAATLRRRNETVERLGRFAVDAVPLSKEELARMELFSAANELLAMEQQLKQERVLTPAQLERFRAHALTVHKSGSTDPSSSRGSSPRAGRLPPVLARPEPAWLRSPSKQQHELRRLHPSAEPRHLPFSERNEVKTSQRISQQGLAMLTALPSLKYADLGLEYRTGRSTADLLLTCSYRYMGQVRKGDNPGAGAQHLTEADHARRARTACAASQPVSVTAPRCDDAAQPAPRWLNEVRP